jgi:hypothetical protein
MFHHTTHTMHMHIHTQTIVDSWADTTPHTLCTCIYTHNRIPDYCWQLSGHHITNTTHHTTPYTIGFQTIVDSWADFTFSPHNTQHTTPYIIEFQTIVDSWADTMFPPHTLCTCIYTHRPLLTVERTPQCSTTPHRLLLTVERTALFHHTSHITTHNKIPNYCWQLSGHHVSTTHQHHTQ